MTKIIHRILFICLLLPLPVLADQFVVEDLRIEGLQRVSAGSVFSAVSTRVGDSVDEFDIQENIRALFKTGLFKNINVYRDGKVLVIAVQERPAISSIDLEGNKLLKDEDLYKSFNENGLSEGQIFKPATLDGLKKALSREYVAQGHYGSKIEAKIRELPRNRIAIDLTIDEGKKAKIKEIIIVGNTQFSDKQLLKQFEIKSSSWRTFFGSKDKYAKEKLSADIESLQSFYNDRGYVKFNIKSTQVSISPDKRSVFITINVDEGDIFKMNEVTLLGELILSEAFMKRHLLLKKGDTFSQARVTSTKELLVQRLSNEGYTFTEVKEIVDINDDDKTVNLAFFVDPKKRAYVRRIEFRGNVKTSDEVLRREMRQMESSTASNQAIELGKIRLDRLGFFKEVETETTPVPGTSDQVDVTYNVEEQNSGNISGSLGYAQQTGVIVSLNLQQNNFLGSGNSVGIGFNRSRYQESVNLSFNDPYFTVDGVSAGYSIFAKKTDYGDFQIATYSMDAFGANVSFGYPLSEVSRISFNLGYENLNLDTGNQASDEIKQFSSIGDKFDQYKLSLGWGRSTLNRGIFADRGSSNSLSIETALPGSDAPYIKFNYSGQYYWHVGGPWTVKFGGKLGWGESLNSGQRLPFFEHFYAGGFGSVRGFERSTLGPRESPARVISNHEDGTLNQIDDADPIGGNVLTTGSVDLILPLSFITDKRSVRASLFMDAGNVFDTKCGSRQVFCFKPAPSKLRRSYGLALSWLSGFGPMSFSFGRTGNTEYLPDNRALINGELIEQVRQEEKKFFQFEFGQIFRFTEEIYDTYVFLD